MRRAWAVASILAVLLGSQAEMVCRAQKEPFQSEAEVAASLQFVPPEAVPEYGTFYFLSAQLDETLPDIPLPWDPYHGTQPIYAIDSTNGVFLIADSPADYRSLTGQSTDETIYPEGEAMSTMDEGGESGFMALGFEPEELGLELTAMTNGTVCLTLHPPESETADGVYDLYSTTTLGTNWLWVLRTDPGQTNVLVGNLSADQCYFILGRTNDTDEDGMSDALEQLVSHTNPNNSDEDSNGIPDGWEWSYFGSLQPGNADYDGDGQNNLEEFLTGSDPNTIAFSAVVTNRYVNVNPVPVQITVSNGVPASMAVLVDSANFAEATWLPYPSPVNITNEGWHGVWIGLRGRLTTSQQAWQWVRFKLDLTPPQLVFTNPVSSTVMQPMIQVQGFCPETLACLSYELTNANGLVTNRPVYVHDQFYDTNTWEFTTNWFQAFDVGLTNGANSFTFHALDLAGNMTTTNITFTLDYSGKTNPPVIRLYWPQDGTQIAGTNRYAWRGWVGDFTVAATATLVDTSGNTNVYEALVERDGNFWVENLPAPTGTNLLQLTVTDVMGNVSTTNITVVRSPVTVTLSAPQVSAGQVYATVAGTIDSDDYTVWVNGVKAWLNGNGSWIASNAPVTPGGTAVFQARAIPNSDSGGNGDGNGGGGGGPDLKPASTANPTSSGALDVESEEDKAAGVYLSSYHYNYASCQEAHDTVYGITDTSSEGIAIHWQEDARVIRNDFTSEVSITPLYESSLEVRTEYAWPIPSWQPDLGTQVYTRVENGDVTQNNTNTVGPASVPWEHRETTFAGGDGISWGQWAWDENAEVKLFTGGKGAPGRENLFVVTAFWTYPPLNDYPQGPAWVFGQLGTAYVSLPDNVSVVTTPTIILDHYGFGESPIKHRLVTQTVCLVPTNTDRTTIGIGEQVVCTMVPPIDARWSVEGGGSVNPTSGPSTTFTARLSSSTSIVHAKIAMAELATTFRVLAPSAVGNVFVYANPGLGSPGTNSIGAESVYWFSILPTNVNFVNVKFRENIPQSPLRTWPNGTNSYNTARIIPFGGGGDCIFINQDTIGDGPYPISRLFNGTNYVDFSYSLSWQDEYQNDGGNWVPFSSLQTTTEYRGSDRACRETYQGVSGSWQGPWQ